jgi:phosphoribosyl-AMP cyclohydrolase
MEVNATRLSAKSDLQRGIVSDRVLVTHDVIGNHPQTTSRQCHQLDGCPNFNGASPPGTVPRHHDLLGLVMMRNQALTSAGSVKMSAYYSKVRNWAQYENSLRETCVRYLNTAWCKFHWHKGTTAQFREARNVSIFCDMTQSHVFLLEVCHPHLPNH